MVTFWRRIRKGVSGIGDTEWALLGFETLGIVFGVLLAVQIGNWIEDRKEAREQRDLLERLFEESQIAVAEVRTQAEFLANPRDRQIEALNQLLNLDSCPTRDGWSALALTQFFPSLRPPSAAYDEMIGSGGLRRLSDPEVRMAVNAFHAELAVFTRQQDFFRDSTVARRDQFQPNFPLKFDAETAEVGVGDSGFEALCGNDAIKFEILSAFRTSRVMDNFYDSLSERAVKMCVALGDEIGRECVPAFGEPLTEEQIENARSR